MEETRPRSQVPPDLLATAQDLAWRTQQHAEAVANLLQWARFLTWEVGVAVARSRALLARCPRTRPAAEELAP